MKPVRNTLLQCSLAVLSLAPVESMAQNAIVNGEFHTDLDGWELTDGTPTWSPLDVDGSETSGSAHVTHPGGSERVCVLRQCVPITSIGGRLLSVWAYTPPGQGSGDLIISYVSRRNSPDCTGPSFAGGGAFLTSVGEWTHHAVAVPVERPLTANPTIEVRICVDPAQEDGFNGYVDGIRLDLGPAIFGNGFE